jgi:hypothetical protein
LDEFAFRLLPTRSGGVIAEQRQSRTVWAKAREARALCHLLCQAPLSTLHSCHPKGGGPARCGAGPPSRISRPVSRVLYGARRSLTRDGHSSGAPVARRFEQPTRTAGSGHRSWNTAAACATPKFHAVPMRFCSRWGLPCRLRCRNRGALLPHRFTLTAASAPYFLPLPGGGNARRYAFCGTVPGVAPAGRYPAPHVHGARTFLPCTPPQPPASGRAGRIPGRPSSRLTTQGMGGGGRGVKAQPG